MDSDLLSQFDGVGTRWMDILCGWIGAYGETNRRAPVTHPRPSTSQQLASKPKLLPSDPFAGKQKQVLQVIV